MLTHYALNVRNNKPQKKLCRYENENSTAFLKSVVIRLSISIECLTFVLSSLVVEVNPPTVC